MQHLMPLPVKKLLDESRTHTCAGFGRDHVCVRIAAIADLPTRFGHFQVVAFYNNVDDKEHVAIVKGDVVTSEDVLVRVHSECLTGDAIGSLRCDCRDQLTASLEAIEREGRGVVLYLRQEGRGIGLTNKLRAYGLQDHGLDTVDANIALGFRDDERDYSIAAHMLDSLKIRSIRLMTNNPRKIEDLTQHGVTVTGRVPLILPTNEFNRDYIETKARRSRHLIDILPNADDEEIEQDEEVVIAADGSGEKVSVAAG